MKLLNKVVLITALLSAPVVAVQGEQHTNKMNMGMGMQALTDEQMSAMQQHMQEMDTLLAKVKQETDQDKRDGMLAEHGQDMEKMMAMMHGGPEGKGHNAKKMANHDAMTPDAHLKMLDQRMAMMEKMMGQMMGHTAEKSKKRHVHKKN